MSLFRDKWWGLLVRINIALIPVSWLVSDSLLETFLQWCCSKTECLSKLKRGHLTEQWVNRKISLCNNLSLAWRTLLIVWQNNIKQYLCYFNGTCKFSSKSFNYLLLFTKSMCPFVLLFCNRNISCCHRVIWRHHLRLYERKTRT